MGNDITRRSAIGLGAAAAALAFGSPAAAAPGPVKPGPAKPVPVKPVPGGPVERIRGAYDLQKARAGGMWHAHIARVNAGVLETVVADDVDHVTQGYSVQKLAVATAVLDKVDRGELSLGQKLELLGGNFILPGSGIYHLQGVYGDQLTIANFLTAMLLVSDNTAVRMCGRVVPALEVNAILAAKGFVHTRVEPVADPNRFRMGTTTPRELHDLLWRLANKTLLAPASCDFMLRILRWVNGYHDGIRRNMSSNERSRVATKYGADFNTLGASRHEAGIMFGTDGAPVLTYALLAEGLTEQGNYGATHPAVEAHAVLGRVMFDTIGTSTNPAARSRHTVPQFEQVDTA